MSSNLSLKSTTEVKSMGTLKPSKSTSTLPAIIPGEQNKMIFYKSLLLSEIILIFNNNDFIFNQNELQLNQTMQKHDVINIY